MSAVAALFVRSDSHYKSFAGVDCYDHARNALTWPGGVPGVFDPPCRAWAKLKGFAKPLPGERDLAIWSMVQARRFGGVVEHPLYSELWRVCGCLTAGIRDEFGGVLVTLNQGWFGHRADKATAIYIVGGPVPELPAVDLVCSHPVERMCKAERERTPANFAAFLVNLAKRCQS